MKNFFRERFKEEKIALFEDVIKDCLKYGQHMFIDIKGSGNEMVKVILNTYKKYPDLYEKAAISSFNPITIYMVNIFLIKISKKKKFFNKR